MYDMMGDGHCGWNGGVLSLAQTRYSMMMMARTKVYLTVFCDGWHFRQGRIVYRENKEVQLQELANNTTEKFNQKEQWRMRSH